MSDAMTTGPSPYVEPALTVRATYHASDGRVPEEIQIEFGDVQLVDADLIDRTVAALARVARGRLDEFTVASMGGADAVGLSAHRVSFGRSHHHPADLAAAGARQADGAAGGSEVTA